MHHTDIHSFDRRQRNPQVRVALSEAQCVPRRPIAPPACFYQTDNPWNNMAGHLIWLGAGEIASYRMRPGFDPNQVLASISGMRDGEGFYEDREAAIAQQLERAFAWIQLKDGTRAGAGTAH